ncbi:heme NO-binding domain-containing protein [Christiangramia sp. OXR-203]|jgi:hypothetical protein|uniref:heme NO-binding domain-containing protein n=1 Tax=Christiangramia sp. OXR-203 TaxID=3100176 RepID=UPI002AC90826|nr:heme NO-binding domain-containing protein [Christiangramia sp. OXR-203]WPY97706.1 heme NO-binding domain-containing protein [Christiangramia sp. OXR-203]
MKGIVFTEFLEMVEQEFGLEVLDQIINESDLSSGGVYTAVGTYDFIEMQRLIVKLSEKTGLSANDLLYAYGKTFFAVLEKNHANIFSLYDGPLEMLASIENHIHVEVRKLYPGAELPTFRVIQQDDNFLEMMYYSDRSMYMFAKALMVQTFDHFLENSRIELEKVQDDGTQVRFRIYKEPHAVN